MDNFIHADTHPGNILVRVAQSKPSRKRLFKSKPQVVFLGVGTIAELCKNDRMNLVDVFKTIACTDGETAAGCKLRLSKTQNCRKPEAFIQVNFVHIHMFKKQIKIVKYAVEPRSHFCFAILLCSLRSFCYSF